MISLDAAVAVFAAGDANLLLMFLAVNYSYYLLFIILISYFLFIIISGFNKETSHGTRG